MDRFLRGANILGWQMIISPFRSLKVFQSNFTVFCIKILIPLRSAVMESVSKDIINNEKIQEMKI